MEARGQNIVYTKKLTNELATVVFNSPGLTKISLYATSIDKKIPTRSRFPPFKSSVTGCAAESYSI